MNYILFCIGRVRLCPEVNRKFLIVLYALWVSRILFYFTLELCLRVTRENFQKILGIALLYICDT